MDSSDEEQWDGEGGGTDQQQQRIIDDDDGGNINIKQEPGSSGGGNLQAYGLDDSDEDNDDDDDDDGVVGITQDQQGGAALAYDDEEELDVLDLDVEDQGIANEQENLLMRFCPHDSSMLYPKEDKRNRALRYACRLCRYSEEATNAIIFKNVLKKELGNVLHKVPSAVSDDPTLPRSQQASCENCGHNEAVFFQSDSSNVTGDSLALIFVCCNCDYKWVA